MRHGTASGADSFDQVLSKEQEAIQARRRRLSAGAADDPAFGIGFSGGGIRSATFNLGILQELARHGVLPYVDYLSTVSGGGYIGSWLHGIIYRHGLSGAAQVLNPDRKPEPAKRDPIAYLRKYSNYLAPRVGLFSQDSWVLGSLWLRNFLLNQCMMVPLFAAVLLLPCLFAQLEASLEVLWYGAALLLVVAVVGAGGQLRGIAARELSGAELLRKAPVDAGVCAFLVWLASVALGWYWASAELWPMGKQLIALWVLFVLFAGLQAGGGFPNCFAGKHPKAPRVLGWLLLLLFALIGTVATTAMLIEVFDMLNFAQSLLMLRAVGPIAVSMALMAGITLLIGLMGADYPDACREWLSRTGSVILLLDAGWGMLFFLGGFAPELAQKYWVTAQAAGSGWIVTTLAGLLAGGSSKTKGEAGGSESLLPTSRILEILAGLAPTVFIAGYLVVISMGNHAVLNAWKPEALPLFGAIAGLALVAVALGSRLNINEFSIHHLYKNRLVRCYLGASHNNRQPNSWTGFDGTDDVPLRKLSPLDGYQGPYAIVNTAANLNSGSELATQDRKAASFFMTPEYCGFQPKFSEAASEADYRGFVPTRDFMPGGPALGTAVAISGAAANPNMGYHTSGPMAFLLTVFNIRLGWWVGNPMQGLRYARRPGPVLGVRYLLLELLGLTTAGSHYLNLSDGGHFENLGLYELARRRCRFILIGDGEQDGDYAFGALAMAIRRCRADFGYDIRLDMARVTRKEVHAVVGKIVYEPGNEGTILYLKSSVTGDEPQDIREYQTRFKDFPHQSTGDQFFDEAQFESYRELGLHVAGKVFAGMPQPQGAYEPGYLGRLFHELGQRWSPPEV